jgi:serine/threonine protein kinase
VHGGPEGVTLRARVESALTRTGQAFAPARAANAVRCIAAGVTAVHEVGVIHRDVTPNNVLVSDGASSETYKLADFGLARVSSASTFGDVLLGTPGYCAPEQSFPGKDGIGPFTDVFGFACTTYFLLTGEPYFTAPSIPETLVLVHAPTRRTLLDARALDPALRADPERCRSLDRVLAAATQARPRERPQTAGEFGEAVLGLLE